jgi:glucosamine-6-phosphate deaminase
MRTDMTAAFQVDALDVVVHADVETLAAAAAEEAAGIIAAAVADRGSASVMLATGNSQLAFLSALVARDDVEWSRVTITHMDEYVGMAPDHPASFARYIRERVADVVSPDAVHYVDGLADPADECARYTKVLRANPLDLCCLGIGENGHLAFNDPPVADFADPHDVKLVALDLASRRQQVGEGHFPDLSSVPTHALTVTVPALLRARRVLAIAPEARKAPAVARTLTGPIGPECPATALREISRATLHLDRDSASELPAELVRP